VSISPLALKVVRRIDALSEIERGINGSNAEDCRSVRQALGQPLVNDLEAHRRAEHPKLSHESDLAKAIDDMLTRWPVFTRFLDDGLVSSSNIAAERGIALGRNSRLFAGSDRGR
jgi:transposase